MLLAENLEQEGNYAAALGVRLLTASFFPFLTNYQALAQTAFLAGNKELAQHAADKAEHIAGMLNDADGLIAKARGMVRWAKQAGEPDLELLYAGWLRNLGLAVEA